MGRLEHNNQVNKGHSRAPQTVPITTGDMVTRGNLVHTGSCLCQAVKYTIDDELKACVNCYCQYCRKAHGSEFVTVAFAQSNKINVTQGAEFISEFPVPRLGSNRCFCSKCGTRIYNIAPVVGMLSLITATLDNPASIRPLANINLESMSPGTTASPGLPEFASSPSGEELGALLSAKET